MSCVVLYVSLWKTVCIALWCRVCCVAGRGLHHVVGGVYCVAGGCVCVLCERAVYCDAVYVVMREEVVGIVEGSVL